MPIFLVSADEQPGTLPRVHSAGGYKQCSHKGLHRAWQGAGQSRAICPGCNRVCILPDGFKPGQEFLTVARPQD